MRTLLCLSLIAAVGCGKTGSPSAPGKADGGKPADAGPVAFTVTAAELADAYDADPKAFAAKYHEKRVEVTGNVGMVRVQSGGTNDVMLEGKPKAKEFLAQYVVVGPGAADKAKHQSLKALAKGQSVTARGTVQKYGLVVGDAEIVKVGPSPAIVTTPSELKAALATEEGQKKFVDKAVVLRGEVRKAEWNGTVASVHVADPGKAGGPELEASVNPNAKEYGEELGKIKPGTVVVIIGEADRGNGGRVWEARVLTDPPEGVTLPEAKK